MSGFHIDPNHGEEAAAFFERCTDDAGYWNKISSNALARVDSRYIWTHCAERLLTLARVYGFWRYATHLERDEAQRYLKMLYALQYRPLAESMP